MSAAALRPDAVQEGPSFPWGTPRPRAMGLAHVGQERPKRTAQGASASGQLGIRDQGDSQPSGHSVRRGPAGLVSPRAAFTAEARRRCERGQTTVSMFCINNTDCPLGVAGPAQDGSHRRSVRSAQGCFLKICFYGLQGGREREGEREGETSLTRENHGPAAAYTAPLGTEPEIWA